MSGRLPPRASRALRGLVLALAATLGALVTTGSATRAGIRQDVAGPDGAPTTLSADVQRSFARGVEAYRSGAYAEARAHWRACLDAPLAPADRARVAYNLGNASYRLGEPLAAVGWYTIALEGDPRDADLWHNLELVRDEAGLPPEDRGDLRGTLGRLLHALLPGEARALFGAGLALLALALLGEALRGGRWWARACWGALVLCVLSAAPWLFGRDGRGQDPLLVVSTPAAELRSEPRTALSPTGRLAAGSEVEAIDRLPGWVRVRADDGARGWVQESAVFDLDP